MDYGFRELCGRGEYSGVGMGLPQKKACNLEKTMIYCFSVRHYIFPCSHFWGARDQKEVQTTMNQYELALVVSAKIEDEARAAVVEQAKELVTRFGGNITNVEDAGRKRLAYEIQKMKEGHYYFIQFDADATTPNEIEQRVRIMDNVIRFLCIRRDAE